MSPPQWLRWARELAAIGRTGFFYATDERFHPNTYDADRYRAVEGIAAEILAAGSDTDPVTIRDVLASDHGHITPKIDVRGVVFDSESRMLLVQEKSDQMRWTLPGGLG
ncbi:NUDIX hydrolase [Euzebya tangerina]|uniref:NUDIX hydrolase n=1 Tax=Euzebya tangerina TaxID=591198 RepID=UPI000E319DF0|nr:NUDIX hydrolase N-terminal domain-containing protein [Euzebya tangerina]